MAAAGTASTCCDARRTCFLAVHLGVCSRGVWASHSPGLSCQFVRAGLGLSAKQRRLARDAACQGCCLPGKWLATDAACQGCGRLGMQLARVAAGWGRGWVGMRARHNHILLQYKHPGLYVNLQASRTARSRRDTHFVRVLTPKALRSTPITPKAPAFKTCSNLMPKSRKS